MTKMRQSCQILRQIEALKGKATTKLLAELLPEIDKSTISSTIGNMLKQDRVIKNGLARTGERGKRYYYRVNDDWEPGLARINAKKRPGQKGPDQKLVRQGSPGNMIVIRFREQKIKMLQRLLKAGVLNGNEPDLAIGLLADLGHRE